MHGSKQKQISVRDLPWSPLNQFVGGSYDRNSQKTHRVNASLSTLEFHALKEDAQRCGVSISARLRDLGLGALKKLTPAILHREEETRKELQGLYRQFVKIGTNINQIARRMNEASKNGQHERIPPLAQENMRYMEEFAIGEQRLQDFIRSNREPILQIQDVESNSREMSTPPYGVGLIMILFRVRKKVCSIVN